MNEAELQEAVLDLAIGMGYLRHHDRPARTSSGWATPIQGEAGFPDLLLTHETTGAIVAAELKSPRGLTTPEQNRWLRAFQQHRCDDVAVALWTPDHWPTDIARVLTELRRQ